MSKYKLTFKAKDDVDFTVSGIEKALVKLGYNRQHFDSTFISGEYVNYDKEDPDTRGHLLWVSFKDKYVEKFGGYYKGPNQAFDFDRNVKLTPQELKLFDSLDFELTYTQKTETGQDITDWWNA